MRYLVLAFALALGACTQTGARTPGGEMFMSDNAILAKDDQQCRSFGAVPGTQTYVACRMNLNQNRTGAAIAQQQSTAGMGAMGLWMMQGSRY